MNTPSFHERFGLPKKGLQVNDIDEGTKIRLWNELHRRLLWHSIGADRFGAIHKDENTQTYIYILWSDVMKWDALKIPTRRSDLILNFKNYLFSKSIKWYQFLEFIEKALTQYIESNEIDIESNDFSDCGCAQYIDAVNNVLTEEACGYRFIGVYLSPIIDEVEINEIEGALEKTESVLTVKSHLKNALMLLSDRERPDYNNSVKESISALEALSRLIVKKPSAVMSSALDEVEKKTKIHPLLKLGLKNLYNWSSDASGVRHANKGGVGEDFDSAKLTLVLCSGLVNYLIAKSEEAGITLQS